MRGTGRVGGGGARGQQRSRAGGTGTAALPGRWQPRWQPRGHRDSSAFGTGCNGRTRGWRCPPAAQRSAEPSCKQGNSRAPLWFCFSNTGGMPDSGAVVFPGRTGSFPSLSAIFRTSLASHTLSPTTSHCLFSHISSGVPFFFSPSLHVYSLIFSASVFLGPGRIRSVSTGNLISELFTLFFFSVSQCKQF